MHARPLFLVLAACAHPPEARPIRAVPIDAEPRPVTRGPSVTVSFVVQPPVGEPPPVLVVRIHNPNPQPIPFVRFDDVACFAHFYLALQITDPNKQPVSLTPCRIKDWPGSDGMLAASSDEEIAVPLAELASTWPLGGYQISVGWDPSALDAATNGTAVRASDSSRHATGFTISRARR